MRIILLLSTLACFATAADKVFECGSAPCDWNNPSFWSPPGVPTATDSVTIPKGNSAYVDGGPALCASLALNAPMYLNAEASLNCGSVTLAADIIGEPDNYGIVVTSLTVPPLGYDLTINASSLRSASADQALTVTVTMSRLWLNGIDFDITSLVLDQSGSVVLGPQLNTWSPAKPAGMTVSGSGELILQNVHWSLSSVPQPITQWC